MRSSRLKNTADLAKLIGKLPCYRKADRFAGLAVAAAVKAVGRTRLPAGSGVVLATTIGPVSSSEQFIRDLKEHGAALASPLLFVQLGFSLAAGLVSITLGLRGPCVTVAGGFEQALQIAAGMIEYGRAPAMLALYVEAGNAYVGVRGRGAVCRLLTRKKGK